MAQHLTEQRALAAERGAAGAATPEHAAELKRMALRAEAARMGCGGEGGGGAGGTAAAAGAAGMDLDNANPAVDLLRGAKDILAAGVAQPLVPPEWARAGVAGAAGAGSGA